MGRMFTSISTDYPAAENLCNSVLRCIFIVHLSQAFSHPTHHCSARLQHNFLCFCSNTRCTVLYILFESESLIGLGTFRSDK